MKIINPETEINFTAQIIDVKFYVCMDESSAVLLKETNKELVEG